MLRAARSITCICVEHRHLLFVVVVVVVFDIPHSNMQDQKRIISCFHQNMLLRSVESAKQVLGLKFRGLSLIIRMNH